MRITYVLPRPELGGGTKVVAQHADLLLGRGHEVTVLGDGPAPDWASLRASYLDSSKPLPELAPQDLVIATFWTTIERARELALGPVAHFCQGYEGSHQHNLADRPAIEKAYAQPGPRLTVTPHLGELLRRRFGIESRVVPPPLDPLFRPRWRLAPRRRPWVAIPGIFGAEVKGVPTAIEAVKVLRRQGVECRVLRISTDPLTDEERELLPPDRYLSGVRPDAVARALRACDLLFLPSEPEEGFGLPLLEAMASKVPAVASEIPSTVFMAGGSDRGVRLVTVGDRAAFAAAAHELLRSPRAWRRARRAGYLAAQRFAPGRVAGELEEAVRWACAEAV
jgi:glycosyltransferase involved in cell wall biosynthesis